MEIYEGRLDRLVIWYSNTISTSGDGSDGEGFIQQACVDISELQIVFGNL